MGPALFLRPALFCVLSTAERVFVLINPQSGKCLDVTDNGATNGVNVRIWECNGFPAQSWSDTNGALTGSGGPLKASGSSKCLDLAGGRKSDGTNVCIWDCHGGSHQSWYFSGPSIKNSRTGTCLDVAGGAVVGGTNVHGWSCNDSGAQKWMKLSSSLQNTYLIKNQRSGLYLLSGSWGSNALDNYVWQYPENERQNGWDGFRWRMYDDGSIQNVKSGMYLRAGHYGRKQASFNHPDNEVWQFRAPNNDDPSFQWELMMDGKIRNKKSGMYLIAGSYGHNHRDRYVWQYPLHLKHGGTLDGFLWERIRLDPDPCGSTEVVGGWIMAGHFHDKVGITKTIKVGWTKETSHTKKSMWQASVGVSITQEYSATVGVPVDFWSVEAKSRVSITISAEYTTGGSTSYTRASSRSKTETIEIAPQVSGTIWQWQFSTFDVCGIGSLNTDSYVMTPNSAQQPCCPPGGFDDASNPSGACLSKDICFCETAVCHFLHPLCMDKNPGCPNWEWYCTSVRWGGWMKANCKKTCNQNCAPDGVASPPPGGRLLADKMNYV